MTGADPGRRSLLRTTGLLGLLTLTSRFTGLARDAVLAAMFGGSRISDVFLIAFEAPNLARRVLGEGALSSFIVPLFSERRKRAPESGWEFCNRAMNAVLLLTLVLTIAGMVWSGAVFDLFGGIGIREGARGAGEVERAEAAEALALGARLTRVMFPYTTMLAVASIMMGVCHSLGSFGVPAFGSIVLNIAMIAAGGAALALKLDPVEATMWLAWSVLAGALWRIALHVPTMRRAGWRYRPIAPTGDPEVRELFRMMGTGLFGLSINQINLSVSSVFAGFLGAGNKTFLVYSNRLIQFPMALTATALATAMLPRLSAMVLEGRDEETRRTIGFSKRLELVLMVPAAVGLMFFGLPIVRLVFERGAFSLEDSRGTHLALMYYAPGLIPFGWSRLVVPLFYARKDVATPVRAALASMVVNVALSAWFTFGTNLEQRGLALASTISAFANYAVLARAAARDPMRPLAGARTGETLLKCGAAALIAVGAARLGYDFAVARLGGLPALGGTFRQAAVLLPFLALAAGLYFPLAKLFRAPEADRAFDLVVKKLRRRKTG